MRIKKVSAVLFSGFLILNLVGCEAFTRKFTRKSKKPDAAIEMVLVPEEYKGPQMPKEDIYRQYYTYWSAWQDELINALTQNASLKKKVDCAEQALKNLVNMKMMLVEDAHKLFNPAITGLNGLLADIKSDVYGAHDNWNRRQAEKMKSNIHKTLIYPKIRNYLK